MAANANPCPWTSAHYEVKELIRNKVSASELNAAVKKVQDLDMFHVSRDARFNLLFHAVTENNLEAFKVLLAKGADVRLANDKMTTIMQLLAKRGLIEWADEAVKGMDEAQRISFLNRGNRHGWTPLMSAAENKEIEFCQWLVKNGAAVNGVMDATGWTAMHAAAKMGCLPIVKMLVENGGDPNMRARNRNIGTGTNLAVKDVTTDVNILAYLGQLC